MPSLDIVTSQSPFHNYLGVPTAHLLFHGRTPYRIIPGNEKWLDFAWKDRFRSQKFANVKSIIVQKGYIPLIKAVATVERSVLVPSDESGMPASELQYESSSGFLLSLNEDESELDDREKMRRLRISKANKGNIPWNKGRKHSPETLQRIRERTRIAMQDPKVKMKLVNIGHSQSEETRVKIGLGVREGWQRRREKLMVQETCCFEWQNAIAEASRNCYSGEEELQWNSYEILDEQLKEEWLESVEKRKGMSRPKGSKRAPKSLEQRRKISEAISAKWADPEYRKRVCSALSKYHGVTVGTGKGIRRKSSGETEPKEKVKERKISSDLENLKFEAQVLKKVTPKKKKNAGPTYKDPMASTKLEMIKKIREQRSEMESRKREATERAKSLIAEAEKAANALEVAALTSPLARTSLLETRKLIAEAMRSIEKIDKGEVPTQDGGRSSHFVDWADSPNDPLTDPEMPSDTLPQDPEEPHINGYQQLSIERLDGSFHFDDSTSITPNGHSPLIITEHPESTAEVNGRPSLQLTTLGGMLDHPDEVASPKFNGESRNQAARCKEAGVHTGKPGSSSASAGKTKKKWIRGLLVEVEDK